MGAGASRLDDFGRPLRDASVSCVMSDRWRSEWRRRRCCSGSAFQQMSVYAASPTVVFFPRRFIRVVTSASRQTLEFSGGVGGGLYHEAPESYSRRRPVF